MSDQDPAEKAAAAVCRYYDAPLDDIRPVAAIIRRVYVEHDAADRKIARARLRDLRQRTKPLDAVGVPLVGGKGKLDVS